MMAYFQNTESPHTRAAHALTLADLHMRPELQKRMASIMGVAGVLKNQQRTDDQVKAQASVHANIAIFFLSHQSNSLNNYFIYISKKIYMITIAAQAIQCFLGGNGRFAF
jgi:hypothetical protein